MKLCFELKTIPDLDLFKYQALSEQGVDGVLVKMESFLRQWQNISSIYKIQITLCINYDPDKPNGENISVYMLFSFEDERLKSSILSMMQASPISDFYAFVICEEIPDAISKRAYHHKHIIKKCERKRDCVKGEGRETIPLFFVETWKGNESGRLYDMLKSMSALNKTAAYCVVLRGTSAYSEVYTSLEKPITFLRNRTINRNSGEIKLIKDNNPSQPRDVAAEETLKVYEEFLKSVSSNPCYRANIYALADDEVTANLILSTACGESVEEGNWEIMRQSGGQYYQIDDYEQYNRTMPQSLKYWSTMFTLSEIAPFFRLPAIYDGENIKIKKETEPDAMAGELYLGTNPQGYDINIPVGLLKKHAFVCGVPGAGKTNTMLHICYTLWKKCRIPFLVMEPAKKEYRALAQTDIEELLVFSPSSGSKLSLTINPFEFPKGMSLSEHIQNLMDVFEGAFPLTPPLPALLDRAIEGVYEDYGWDTDDINDGEKTYPTMRELYDRLSFELEQTDYDGEVRGNMKSALEMRIGSLLRRDLGNVFDARYSTLSPESLLKYPIIIEMESLGRGPSNFMTLMLCTLIREVLRVDPNADSEMSVRHVIFIEEAHNLIAQSTGETGGDDANPKIAATNYIVAMLAEVRALREGIIIADQLPTAMAPEVIKNTNLKIVHRLTSSDDRGLIGSTMSASDMQVEALSTYLPGNALITYEGLLKPFRMQITAFELKDAPDTSDLLTLMRTREKQVAFSRFTTDVRLDKLKEKWESELNQMMVDYNKLVKDCSMLRTATIRDDIKELISIIIKDQLGIDEYIKPMRKILRKYQKTLKTSLVEYDDEFIEDAHKTIEKIENNVRLLVESCNDG